MKKVLVLLLLGGALAACSEQPTSPPAEPAFDISNGPAESGIVLRGQWGLGLIWGVPDAGVIVFAGAHAREDCAAWALYGDPDPEHPEADHWLNHVYFDPVTWADKVLSDRLVGVAQGSDVPTEVWAYSGGHFPVFCPSILADPTIEPLAEGVTHVIVTSNDEFFGRTMGSVYQVNLHGMLERPDGTPALFAFQLKFRNWEPSKVTVSLK
ncbi:MAG: hypothetical protein FIB01_05745 [Gemmatimonadetes bacterium]|nr:hypothetical protein [Gemmatimonadota bacterium]